MRMLAVVVALMLVGAVPASAMSCCGSGKGKAGMCARGDVTKSGGMAKASKGCCCQGMAGNMSKRG